MHEMLMVEIFRSRHEERVRDAAVERQRHNGRLAAGAGRSGASRTVRLFRRGA